MTSEPGWLTDGVLAHLREVAAPPTAGEGELPAPATFPTVSVRYELRNILGQGGMGVVYCALDRDLGREVALKVVSSPVGVDVDVAEQRLMAEARILARLEHPGLVPVHDLGTLPDGRAFYAMKLVDGTRLDTYANELLPGDRAELLRVFERVCEAVAFAHAHGVIHRDLKPENVMVGPFGEVLVLDWGLAKARSAPPPSAQPPAGAESAALPAAVDRAPEMAEPRWAAAPATSAGTLLGTPGYIAPEMRAGAAADERSEVFALGAILRFLVTGAPPDSVPDASGAYRQIRVAPKALLAICSMATADHPAGRYESVAALARDLACYRAGLPVAAVPANWLRRAWLFARRHATPILLLLTYLLLRMAMLLLSRHR